MGLFSKKQINETLVSPIDGSLIPLEKVEDNVFSKKMMGDGFAIIPKGDNVVSPVDGKISSVFPTLHALMIRSNEGLEIMLHLGLDTVELNGEPFEVKVERDQTVTAGQPIATMNIADIKKSGKNPTVLVIVSNMDKVKKVSEVHASEISAGIGVQSITVK
jgi:PTS system glucose-specific IIA component